MAIVKLYPEQNAQIQTTTPDEAAKPNESNFNELVPEQSIVILTQYTEGAPWSCNYYGQIVNKNNTLNSYDPAIPNLLNPYYKINELQLNVSSAITSNYDSQTGITKVSGSSALPLGLIPNVGDIFVAKVDNGEDAIFIIDNVTRLTHHKKTLYEINYNLYAYVSANPAWLDNIESKVQTTYYFNPNYLNLSQEMLITPEVKEAKDRLETILNLSRDYYFTKFINPSYKTFVLPGTDKVLCDPLLINFILKTNSSFKYPILTSVYINSDYNDYYLKDKTILDAIVNREEGILRIANKNYSFASTLCFRNTPILAGMGLMGIEYMIYPSHVDLTRTFNNLPFIDNSSLYQLAPTANNSTIDPSLVILTLDGPKPILHPLFTDNSYIVSPHFYTYLNDASVTNANNISFIELLIYKHIKSEGISYKDMYMAIRDYHKWPTLHQFYLLPVLWTMIGALK